MSCTSSLNNNDIQMPVQISVPCIKPYFHKDTLTPPYSSRYPPHAGGGPSTYAAHDASLIMHAIYFEIYAPPLEGIQLKSIAGYEAFVCVCFYAYKTPFIWTPVCVYTARKNHSKKYLNKNEKHFNKK